MISKLCQANFSRKDGNDNDDDDDDDPFLARKFLARLDGRMCDLKLKNKFKNISIRKFLKNLTTFWRIIYIFLSPFKNQNLKTF